MKRLVIKRTKTMSDIKDQKTTPRQLSIIDFCNNLPLPNQQTSQFKIIQFPERQVSKSRKKALERVIEHAKSLNW